jgi:hypothetical protein
MKDVLVWTGFIRVKTVTVCSGYSNQPSGAIKAGDFLG